MAMKIYDDCMILGAAEGLYTLFIMELLEMIFMFYSKISV